MKKFERVLVFLKNKYILAILSFLVWMTFFDRNDFISQYNYRQELNKLLEDKGYYQGQIEEDKKSIHELMSNPRNLEKFAREKYHMKKDDEDVFLIIPASDGVSKSTDENQESDQSRPGSEQSQVTAMQNESGTAH